MFYFPDTASLSCLPTLNLTAVVAGTSTTLSVPGTLAVLAALLTVEKEPKPIKLTLLPAFKASVIVSIAASITAFTSFFESLVLLASASINSAFFVTVSFLLNFGKSYSFFS